MYSQVNIYLHMLLFQYKNIYLLFYFNSSNVIAMILFGGKRKKKWNKAQYTEKHKIAREKNIKWMKQANSILDQKMKRAKNNIEKEIIKYLIVNDLMWICCVWFFFFSLLVWNWNDSGNEKKVIDKRWQQRHSTLCVEFRL